MPAWATVAISLGTALISAAAALLGSFIRGRQELALQLERASQEQALELERGRQERALQLHDRRIEAAGDFSVSANKASTDIKDAVRSARTPGNPANKEVLERLHEGLHEAEAYAVVASLLFKACCFRFGWSGTSDAG